MSISQMLISLSAAAMLLGASLAASAGRSWRRPRLSSSGRPRLPSRSRSGLSSCSAAAPSLPSSPPLVSELGLLGAGAHNGHRSGRNDIPERAPRRGAHC